MKTWAEQIKKNGNLLSKTELEIVDFIRANPEKAAFMRQIELCEEANVSKPLVISCFRKLQYEDFKSFQQSIQDFYSNQITSYQASTVVFRETHDIGELLRHSINVDLQALSSMEKLLNPEQIEMIAGKIITSSRVFILSDGTGFYPAHYLHRRLLRYGISASLIGPDRTRMLDELSGIKESDCLIDFHYTQPGELINDLLSFSKKQGAYSVLITGKLDTDLVPLANQSIFVPRGQISFKNSMGVPMWFANFLLLAVELKAGEPLQEHLKELEKIRIKTEPEKY
ncbi:MAG: MurR/RpiR family transcriptional regulator [Spirochaetales bacterium]|nr:MurR/RpiR family transcriptional regulator [Spirochaetales bacterium]